MPANQLDGGRRRSAGVAREDRWIASVDVAADLVAKAN